MNDSKAKIIKGSELTDLLSDPDCVVDEKLSQQMPWPVYSLPGGRVLFVVGNRRGCLWMSRHDVEAELNKEATVENPLAEYRFGPNFLKQLPELLVQAQTDFSLPTVSTSNLDHCMQCLEESIQRAGPRKCLKGNVFPVILAYAGEILRIGLAGKWVLQVSPLEPKILEPWIYGQSGKKCPLAGVLCNELYEYGRKGSVVAILRLYMAN